MRSVRVVSLFEPPTRDGVRGEREINIQFSSGAESGRDGNYSGQILALRISH